MLVQIGLNFKKIDNATLHSDHKISYKERKEKNNNSKTLIII